MIARRLLAFLSFALVMAGGVLAVAHRQARADPVVRRASIALPRWPADAPPVTVALLSDLHVGNAAMDAERLARIVTQVNRLKPDLVVIAGDFIAGHTPADASAAPQLAPLRRLTPRLGTIAVLGNHDYWTDPSRVRATLRAAGVTVLANEAVRRGPLAIGGLDDQPTHHDRLPATLVAMRRLGGASVMVAHSPDIAPGLPDDVPLLMAGHTHCGQIVLPLYGALGHVSRFGDRYRCGVVREGDRTTIIGAGLGTSVLPLRLGAPADLWLVRLSG